MIKLFAVLTMVLLWVASASAQVINCPNGFSSSGACGVGNGQPWKITGTFNGVSAGLDGSKVKLVPSGANHVALSLNYQPTKVNSRAFTSTFTFIPNDWNVAFLLNNSDNNPWGFNGANFSAGAGCEADFFQGFSQPEPVNNVFALLFDSSSPLTEHGAYTYSSVQVYKPSQSPCNPNLGGDNFDYYSTTKISTSPVPLNSPPDQALTTTGDTYSATVVYDGNNLTVDLSDVTKGGPTFDHTFNHVDIPSWAAGSTAWFGFGGATNMTSKAPLYVNSAVYSEGSTPAPTPTPAPTSTPTPVPPELIDVPLSNARVTIENGKVTITGTLPPQSERHHGKKARTR
jgi:hypothetical protein